MKTRDHCPRCGSDGVALLLHPHVRICSDRHCDLIWIADLAAYWPDLEDVPAHEVAAQLPNETLSALVCDAVIDWTLDEQGVDFSPLPREE